ncbi:DUF2892 domain-containing protein [Mangrovivirga sp. M17]|uniref:DUF2892 domain-containing protein n=1 Tax=Mangrovivirga halotolerans TaxID=2993936 RepID=A0ABT3RNK3_9BACT|nr:DUF2892 domain-containing protein [Mangrovivirga halotolerans]MCX2743176.1 DUF2892 domain-containing protein [Mangrovivirga halotolerans]
MKKNMGTTDRVIRTIIALTLIALFVAEVLTGVLGFVMLILAVIFLLTSFAGFCPLYKPFGISTCPRNKQHR